MHVLKGAVVEVLGPRKFTFAGQGVLKFRSEGPITQQEVSRIESAANRKVAEDLEVAEFEMEREEAEAHFGRSIYDLVRGPIPTGVLKISGIPDWETSCCSSRHVETTGSIGAVKVDGATFLEAGKELELRFHLL
jgi:alanyl-tRNA synthetase